MEALNPHNLVGTALWFIKKRADQWNFGKKEADGGPISSRQTLPRATFGVESVV
jgi:hypothetical protein